MRLSRGRAEFQIERSNARVSCGLRDMAMERVKEALIDERGVLPRHLEVPFIRADLQLFLPQSVEDTEKNGDRQHDVGRNVQPLRLVLGRALGIAGERRRNRNLAHQGRGSSVTYPRWPGQVCRPEVYCVDSPSRCMIHPQDFGGVTYIDSACGLYSTGLITSHFRCR